MKYELSLCGVLVAATLIAPGCGDDDAESTPLSVGSSLTIRNTYEQLDIPAITPGAMVTVRNTIQDPTDPGQVEETVFATFFGLAEDGLDLTASVSDGAEFPETLAVDLSAGGGPTVNALYSIDLSPSAITFELVATASDPFWSDIYGVITPDKYDRYYFTFAEPHHISGFTSTDDSVNLRIDSDTVVVVEVGEGFDVKPGAGFTIELESDDIDEVSFASFLGLPEDGLDLEAELSASDVEFTDILALDASGQGGPVINGLYDIDLTATQIAFTLLPTSDDPFWSGNFRTMEAGAKDRYYITLGSPHMIDGFTSSDPAVNLRLDSATSIVVEIGGGYEFQPGAAFTIDLN